MVDMLQTKILRDVSEHRFSFIAIVCVCALGIAIFSGMNLYVSTVQNELDRAYSRANLADYWVYKPGITEDDLTKILAINEVDQAERRKIIELPLAGYEGSALRLHGMEGRGRINLPELLDGSFIDERETGALLLDNRFAEANGISVGDVLFLGAGEGKSAFSVKGIIRSAEYVSYTPNGLTIPDYKKYGFAYTNARSLPQTGFNELVIIEDRVTSQADFAAQIRSALGSVSIIDRQRQESVGKIEDDLNGNRQIGTMFPIVFFLTAALVTWITVGRMLETQRQNLGTLRSLGFSKREMISRYMLYGILITVPSMAAGWLVSRYVIAQTLYNIATKYYTLEASGVDLFSWHILAASVGVVLVTCGAVFLTCRKTLSAMPAALIRPKPPAHGHRILLERIVPLWGRLSFSGKIVARNLFRNKARMVMGILGIAGSSALILCGFGIMSSISALIDRSFTDIIRYSAEVKLKTPLSRVETAELVKTVKNADGFTTASSFTVSLNGNGGNQQSAYLVVLEDEQTALSFKDLAGNAVSLPVSGALITPRMASSLNVSVGSEFIAETADGMVIPLSVAGIVDFPIGNEIYIGETAFQEISDIPFSVRVFFIYGDGLELDALRADPRVALAETKEEMRANLSIVLEILRGIQGILIVFSCLLSFAVLIVLGRLNFDERIRELATLKVLGFKVNEMKRLVLSENIWITLIAIPLGAALSYALLRAVLSLATSAEMEIAPTVSIFGLLSGSALTLIFTLFVNDLMGRQLRGIDMVSSLKSVE
jgi:putative ABC transport system permease protein